MNNYPPRYCVPQPAGVPVTHEGTAAPTPTPSVPTVSVPAFPTRQQIATFLNGTPRPPLGILTSAMRWWNFLPAEVQQELAQEWADVFPLNNGASIARFWEHYMHPKAAAKWYKDNGHE